LKTVLANRKVLCTWVAVKMDDLNWPAHSSSPHFLYDCW